MFRKAARVKSYDVDEIENLIGVGLPNRNKFMNYGDVAASNIYSGYAIGKVYEADPERLSFEFDAVYLSYLLKEVERIGVDSSTYLAATEAVFENFELPISERKLFYERVTQYRILDHFKAAETFVDNLQVDDFPESYRGPSNEILGRQFDDLSSAIKRYVNDQLKATK